MKRKRKNMLAAFIAAVVTFGSLYAFAGEKYFAKRHNGRFCSEHRNNQMHANDWYKDGERPAVKNETTQ